MSLFRLLDRTPWLAADDLGGPALVDFLARARRLPTFSRIHTFHEGDARLARALRPLQGKFSVVNPAAVVPVPARLAPALRHLLHRLRDAGAAPRFALVLEEPACPVVEHEVVGDDAATPGQAVRFHGTLDYRLIVELEQDAGDLAARLRELLVARARPAMPAMPATSAAAPEAPSLALWFHFPLLVPDAEAQRQMTLPALHFYRDVTGRLSAGARDRYWHLDAWERFHEDGQMIGCVVPSLVAHGYVGGTRRVAVAPPAGDADAPRQLTPDFDRRGFVPPGYCLIHYVATIELAVAAAEESSAAA